MGKPKVSAGSSSVGATNAPAKSLLIAALNTHVDSGASHEKPGIAVVIDKRPADDSLVSYAARTEPKSGSLWEDLNAVAADKIANRKTVTIDRTLRANIMKCIRDNRWLKTLTNDELHGKLDAETGLTCFQTFAQDKTAGRGWAGDYFYNLYTRFASSTGCEGQLKNNSLLARSTPPYNQDF